MPGFRDHVLFKGGPNVGRSIMARPLWEAVRVQARLEQASPSQGGSQLPGRLRRRRWQLHCVCGCGASTWADCGASHKLDRLVCAVPSPRSVPLDAAKELSLGSGHVCVSLYSAQRLLQREVVLLLEAKKAAGEWVSDAETAFFDGRLCSEQTGGGRVGSSVSRQGVAFPGDRKQCPITRTFCRLGPSILPGLRADGMPDAKGLVGICVHFVGFSLRPLGRGPEGSSYSSDFQEKTGPVNLVEGALQLHVKKHRFSSLCFWSQRLMAWTMASQPFFVPNSNCAGRRYRVLSSETAASKAFAVRCGRVSPSATGRWLPFYFLKAVSECIGKP